MRSFSFFENALFGDSAVILRTLLQLRVLVFGALVGFLWILDKQTAWPVHYSSILLIVGCAIVWSAWLLFHFKRRLFESRAIPSARHHLIEQRAILRELIIDGFCLALVVFLSGRSENPFIYYFLVLIAVAATVLSGKIAWLFAAVGVCVYSLFLYLDINEHFHHMSDQYQFHLLGMWVNFFGSSLVTCYFISKLANALREQQQQLGKIREETLKNEQLIGIGTLAASTVHALGTPLSTLAVLLGEMRNSADTEEKRTDIDTMLTQIQRCTTTMKKLSMLADYEDDSNQQESVAELAATLREHYVLSKPSLYPSINLPESTQHQRIRHSLLLHHALINLVDNAIEAAQNRVSVDFDTDRDFLYISIVDDGPGMPLKAVKDWGKPQHSSKKDGLGIGVLLANSTIERLGGTVAIHVVDLDTAAPKQVPQTHVQVKLPLSQQPHLS